MPFDSTLSFPLERVSGGDRKSMLEDWSEKFSTSKNRVFYVNKRTGETTWEKPTCDDDGVTLWHILVKHTDSRNPTSWRQTDVITRSQKDALNIINGNI